MQIKNETVLVSGGSSGIGAAIAQKFSAEGYSVLLLGRDEKKLMSVQLNCRVKSAEFLAFDLKSFKQFEHEINKKLDQLPRLTTLINNAGIYKASAFMDTTDEVWLEHFKVNLLSAVQLTKLAWTRFKNQKQGSIVNVASTLGVKPAPGTSAYSALKAAMVNWTLTLAQEGGADRIRANCVCPGIIDTPIHAFHGLADDKKKEATKNLVSMQLLNDLGQASDVAEAVYFLGSDLSRWTTGAILNVDGGINIK